MFDIVILGGMVIDGTGARAIRCDVGIIDGKISALGFLEGMQSALTIPAEGKIVAPGFIDIHTHTDYSILIDNRAESQIRQGVTTELVGLCGFGFAPCTDETRSLMLKACPTGNILTRWYSFAEYLDTLAEANPATNIAALVSHASLRHITMNNNCSRAASEKEVQRMVYYLDASLKQGGFGLSTGLEYFPGKQADVRELEALCRVVGRYGGMHASHVRNRDNYALLGFCEVIEVARNTGSRLQISHINPKYGRPPTTIHDTIALINAARDTGVFIGIDVMPTNWNYTAAKALLPIWAHDLCTHKLLTLLQSYEGRASLFENPTPIWRLPIDGKWDQIRLFNANNVKRHVGKAMSEIAEEIGISGWDTLCTLLAEEGEDMGKLLLTSESFFTEDIVDVLQDPYCAVCSDAVAAGIDGPLANLRVAPNSYVWSERFLRNFIIEKKVLSLEEGIRRITSLPAKLIGLPDRGCISPGFSADIVIFSIENLGDKATIKNPNVYPEGIQTVLVNGSVAYNNGKRNKNHTGQVLRFS